MSFYGCVVPCVIEMPCIVALPVIASSSDIKCAVKNADLFCVYYINSETSV